MSRNLLASRVVEEQVEDPVRVGDVVGDCKVTWRLGQGGFGVVYAGERLTDRAPVAIKCLHKHLTSQKDIVTRFRREALAASKIGHANIVKVHESGTTSSGVIFIVMELLEGRDLAAELKEGPLSISRAVTILAQVCDALSAAHAVGIVHRDLKPDNIFLVGDEPKVKLLDFGISKFTTTVDNASLMTRTGTQIGTPFYMSPEQAQGKRSVDHRADVYGVGVLLFRMLTGHHPFEDDSYPMLVVKICTNPPPAITTYRQDAPPEIDFLLERLLAKHPDDRFDSCAMTKQALLEFAHIDRPPELTGAAGTRGESASALSSALARTQASTPRSLDEIELAPSETRVVRDGNRWVFFALGAALLALIAGGLYFFFSQQRTQQPVVAELPEPRPPIVAPLRTPPASNLDWTWQNPLPRALPTFNDVAVGGPGLIAVVGRNGLAAKFRENTLTRWTTGVEVDLHGIGWAGPMQGLAVGDEGTLVVMMQSGSQSVSMQTEATLRGIVVLSPTEQYVVGDEGTLLHLVALRPERLDAPSNASLTAVANHDGAIYAVGADATILRVALGETNVVSEHVGTGTLRAVGGCPDGDVYAAGDSGALWRRVEGPRWAQLRVEVEDDLLDIGCDAGRVVVAGSEGHVLLVVGDEHVILNGGTRGFRGAGSANGEATYLVGDGGQLARLDQNRVRIMTSGPTDEIFDLETLGGVVVAVGRWGTVLRAEPDGVTKVDSGTHAGLSGIAKLEEHRLIAVGDAGVMLSITWDAVAPLESDVDANLHSVVARDGWMTAVGSGGAIVRGTEGAFATTTVNGVETLWAIAGEPDAAIAVGDRGVVLRIGEQSHDQLDCGVNATLRGVMIGEEAAFAVGDDGVVVRIEESECVIEHQGTESLYAVGIGPSGAPLAVGRGGAALTRGADGGWSTEEVSALGFHLNAIHRTARDVYVAGQGGALLRHRRVE